MVFWGEYQVSFLLGKTAGSGIAMLLDFYFDVTHCYKFNPLKKHNISLFSYSWGAQKSKLCWQGCVASGDSREEFTSLPVPASGSNPEASGPASFDLSFCGHISFCDSVVASLLMTLINILGPPG